MNENKQSFKPNEWYYEKHCSMLMVVRLQFPSTDEKQMLNSGFWWSILTGQLWSSPLVFPLKQDTTGV